MKLISRKKEVLPISRNLDKYLRYFDRGCRMSLEYDDLLKYHEAFALYDKEGNDSLWSTVAYDQGQIDEIHSGLLKMYSHLRSLGEVAIQKHLVVDRIDLCLYGNTKPFRIRILNTLNENFEYFYVKDADASRIYGLELEHVLSPNRIGFLYGNATLVEEHIYGIPGDIFLKKHAFESETNHVRLAKEFVKFNERCFIRLLGDMHAANFVVDITMDFEENFYRIRGIDFDQQSYEPVKKVYLPQFYKENKPFVDMVMEYLSQQTIEQYQQEERALIKRRMKASRYRLMPLLDAMACDRLAPRENQSKLAAILADHYKNSEFTKAKSMGDLVKMSLKLLDGD